MAPGFRRAAGAGAIFLLLVILAGCSSTRLAYRYADWGIVWWVEDYVTLSSAQRGQLERDIDELLQWHCREELPRYSRWLTDLETGVATGALNHSKIARHQAELFQRLDSLLVAVTPAAVSLLASLNDSQIEELTQSMAEDQREKEQEYLNPDPRKQRLARAERVRERAEKRLGNLNNPQRQLIATWNRERGDQTRVWLESRERWQAALLEALADRKSAGFTDRIEGLIQSPGNVMGAPYRAMAADSRAALTDLAADLLATADREQRRHLTGQLAELRRDFNALSCR
ncbi:MAG: hypothetical protein KGY54_06310 [Oleiphilaceae bacterium]|nr:hypothetical protein [Oleiphilaceae bacterium]